MEIIFQIPTIVSFDVPAKIIPALCKLMERNILLSYASVLKQAAILRFLGPYKGLSDSASIMDRMGELVNLLEQSSFSPSPSTKPPVKPGEIGGGTAEGDKWAGKPETLGKDAREVPRGISFFSTISLEPTYLEIPLEGRTKAGSEETTTRIIRVGMKAMPFKVEGVTDLMTMMADAKKRSYIQTLMLRYSARLSKFWNGPAKGEEGMKTEFMKTTPTSKELENPKYLSRLMAIKGPVYWSPTTIFVSDDFAEKNLKDLLWIYRDLVKGGWGDLIVFDDSRDIISFCTQKTLACQQLHTDYIKELLNLDNVIDADLFKKASRGSSMFPGRKVPISKVFESTCVPCSEKGVESILAEIVKGV